MDEPTSLPPPGPFAVEMRVRRQDLGYTIPYAARLAGISPYWWRCLEAGYGPHVTKGYVPSNPSTVTTVRIARALGLDEQAAMNLAGFEGYPIPEVPEVTDVELIAQLPPKQRDEVMRYAKAVAAGALTPQTS